MENKLTFSNWLLKELRSRDWSQADLARKGKIKTPTLSRIISGERNVGSSVAESISNALGYPPEFVFRMAGILPPVPEHTEQIDQLTYLFNKFSEVEKKDLLTYMRIKLMMVENNTRDSSR